MARNFMKENKSYARNKNMRRKGNETEKEREREKSLYFNHIIVYAINENSLTRNHF